LTATPSTLAQELFPILLAECPRICQDCDAVKGADLDRELLEQLSNIPEIELSGFSVREGLSGSGVTVLRGDSYFGSWRVSAGQFIWLHADLSKPCHTEESIGDALRYTLLLILRNLEFPESKPVKRARTG
jgi:hypothetical protein